MSTNLNPVHSFEMGVLSAFKVLLYIIAIVEVDATMKDVKVNSHRAYAVGTHIGIAFNGFRTVETYNL